MLYKIIYIHIINYNIMILTIYIHNVPLASSELNHGVLKPDDFLPKCSCLL